MISLMDIIKRHEAVLAGYSRRVRFPAGECIFRIGETDSDKAYVLLSGEVSITRLIKTTEKELAVLKEGDVVGEVALFSRGPRTATARTKTEVEAFIFSRQDLARLKEEQLPVAYEFIERLLEVIAERLRNTLERFEVVYFWLS